MDDSMGASKLRELILLHSQPSSIPGTNEMVLSDG